MSDSGSYRGGFVGLTDPVSTIGTKVNLLGSTTQETALVDQWVHFAEHEISVPTQNITGMVYGHYVPFSLEVKIRFTM